MYLVTPLKHRFRSVRLFVVVLAVLATVLLMELHQLRRVVSATSTPASVGESKTKSRPLTDRQLTDFGKTPISFERNVGQTDPLVKFLARGSQYGVSLTSKGALITLSRATGGNARRRADQSIFSIEFKGAASGSTITAENELPGKVNYLKGNKPEAWHTNLPTFSQVRYEKIYPGVDLTYYGNQQQLEWDLSVAPGADVNQIRMSLGRSKSLSLVSNGDLRVGTKGDAITIKRPYAYQIVEGTKREVASRYVLKSKDEVGFKVGHYDRRLPLIIDPVLVYSTYLGGNDQDQAFAIAVDSTGSAYIVGQTLSLNFPTNSALQSDNAGFFDVFVTKLSANGSTIVYSTFLGGVSDDIGMGVTVDSAGQAYLTGITSSPDFPTANSLQPLAGSEDAFVAELSSNGSSLIYSTFLGGIDSDGGFAIAVDAGGNAYITGTTNSADFPTTNPIQSAKAGHSLFKSNNSAGNWTSSDAGLTAGMVNKVVLEPGNPTTLFAVTGHAIFKSSNSASSWARVHSQPITSLILDVAINPSNTSIIYAAGDGGILKSTDGGVSFTQSSNGLNPPFADTINIDPVTPSTLYCHTISNSIGKSTDAGANWTVSFVSGSGLNDINSMAIDPVAPGTLYIATNRGVFKSTNGAGSWSPANTGITSEILEIVAIDPTNHLNIFAGGRNGVFKSTDSGASWTNIRGNLPAGFNVLTLALDPTNSSTIYAGGSRSSLIYKTTDGGANWQPANSGFDGFIANSIVVDPGSPATVYVGTSPGPDGFITKLSANGANRVYSTYIGGQKSDGGAAIAVDSTGSVFVGGGTSSLDFPLVNPFQAARGDSSTSDAYVLKLNPTGSALVYSSYLGGDSADALNSLAIDSGGNVYVGGETSSTTFPVVNAFQTSKAAASDAFVSKINSSGTGLVFSTYLGGANADSITGLALDSANNIYLTGVTSSADFPVVNAFQPTRSGTSDAFVSNFNATGSALIYSSYLGGSGAETARAIAVDSHADVYVAGFTSSANFPTLNPRQATYGGNVDAFVTKLTDPTTVQFAQGQYSVGESAGSVQVNVSRTGSLSGVSTVDYASVNGTASDRSDFTAVRGTLRFEAGESQKSFLVLLTDDVFVEGAEAFTIILSNATGAVLAGPSDPLPGVVSVNITDNDSVPPTSNPIDGSEFFVRQHYHDFLNRTPDSSGLQFWVNSIEECGADAQCRELKRINASAAFFLSIEFQSTGYFVYRAYKSAYGDTTSPNVSVSVPIIRLSDFLADTQKIGQNVIVGQGNWEQTLESNKTAYALEFVQRARFTTDYPNSLSADQFVTQLDQRAGQVLSTAEKDQLVTLLGSTPADVNKRALVLRAVTEDSDLQQREFNRAFVLMQFYGYLRRNPDDPQDTDFRGWEFWLNKLNQFNGNFVNADMVKAFIVSEEYRRRFGP